MIQEGDNTFDLKKIGISDIESDLLNYINNAVREIIDRIQGSTLNLKFKYCKELLKICSAIKQDILGDFPRTTLILNDLLWKLIIKALDISCCCDNTHQNTIYDDNNSIATVLSNSTNSTCCLILKQSLIDLLFEMLKSTSIIFDNIFILDIIPKDLLERIVIFSVTIVPDVVNYAIKNCINPHCECRIEAIVPIFDIIVQDKISFFNESLMRSTRLWTGLFKLISTCSEIKLKLIKILESEANAVLFQDNNLFREIKVEIINSSRIMCKTLTKLHMEDCKGLFYYSTLAFADIISQFVLYVSCTYKMIYLLGNDHSDSYLKEMMILLNNKFKNNIDYNGDFTNITEYFHEETSEGINKNAEISFGINLMENSDINIETDSIINCIKYLLINKNIIQVDSLRSDFKNTFRSTIIGILEHIFKNENLEILDSIAFTNQTLFVFDHINNYLVNVGGQLGINKTTHNDDKYISKDHIIKFIKSPSHTVSLIVFLLESEHNESLIQRHLELIFELLFDLNNSPFKSLIFVTLNHLFTYIFESEQKKKVLSNISLVFKLLKRKVIKNKTLLMSSSLVWISKILILKEIYSEKNEEIFISINELIKEWENSALIEYSDFHSDSEIKNNELIELQRSIILCEIFSESVYDSLNISNHLDFVLLFFKCFKRDRDVRRSAVIQLINILGSKPSFPKNKLEIELLLDSQENVERYWEINTRFLFNKYFTLIEFKSGVENKADISNLLIDDNLKLGYDIETNISPLNLPDLSQISKMLNIIKNNRIQTQIKVSAIYSITESLTSTRIPFGIFRIYTDELIKLLMQHTCKKYMINSTDENNMREDDISLFGIAEIVYQEESSLFYHLSVALNAIIVSRSYKNEFVEYFVGGYSLLLLNHLSYWLFSSSEDCRCSSSSLISTILIMILKTGLLGEQKVTQNIDEQVLEKTCKEVLVSSFLNKLLIIPTSKKIVEHFNKQYEVDILTSSSEKSYLGEISKTTDDILNNIYKFMEKDQVDDNTYLAEVIFSIFSLTFPWTKLTVFAIHFDTCELRVKESVDSVFSKLIIFLNSSNFETMDDIANYLELLNISYFNIDLKLLSVLKITSVILDSYYFSDKHIFMESVPRYLTHFIVISSFFNSFFKEKDFEIHIGSIRPPVSLNIFDIICLCLESFEGKLSDLFFELLPDNIQWSFLVLQVPKLIDPLNSASSPTTLMMTARLLSKMPLKRWLEEDPRHTISCLKLLMNNKNFICNREFSEVSRTRTFQESSFVNYLLEIFEKVSIANLLNHPLIIYLQKNLLKWIYVVGMVSSSFEIQKRIWDLKVLLLDKWEIEFSGNIYSLVSNMKIPESLSENKNNERITWGYLISHSLDVISALNNFLIIGSDFVDFSIRWRIMEFYNYFLSVIRYLDICLGIHYKPIEILKNNKNEAGDEFQLVSATFNISFENVVDTLFPQLTGIIFNLEANGSTSSELVISNKLKILILKVIIIFFGKISAYLPFSSHMFKKISENSNDLLLCINRLIHLNIEDNILYSMISIIVNTIKIDSCNSNILQEQLYLILSNTDICKANYSELIQLALYSNELLHLDNGNVQINDKLLKKVTSLSIDFFYKLSEFMFDMDIMNLVNGFLILKYNIIKTKAFKRCFPNFDSELKVSLLTSILIGISFITRFVVEKSLIEDYNIDYNSLQDSLLVSISSLTIIKPYYLNDIMELLKNSLELKTTVLAIWSDCNKLIDFINSFNIVSSERKLELHFFIDYILNIVTINTFSKVLINSIFELDVSKFVRDLYNQFLYITVTNRSKDYSFYTLTYFASLFYDIKAYLSSNDIERAELRSVFNFNSFNIGLLNCILEKATALLVELREVCLGELRSHTIASIRAMSNQNIYIYKQLTENAFLSRLTCLFRFLRIIGIYLSEFEGHINLFTNKKLKPLLSFVVESLALLNCIIKQLDSEIERNNLDGFRTCLKNWWSYTNKLTKGDNDFATFSGIFMQIISLTISCSSLIIPISDSKLIINETQNSVPLSDITRSQKHGSGRLHDLFLSLLETESSIGLRLGIGLSHLPIEINEENGNLSSNMTQRELSLLNGNNLKISQKNNLWLEGIVLNDSVPVSIRSGVLRLFINLGLSSSRKKFFKHWRIDETEENIKILEIIEKSRLAKNMEFITLSFILLDLILSFNSSPIFDSLNKLNHRIYSISQCKKILNVIERLKLEISTFKDYKEITEQNPIIEKLIDKCCNNLTSKTK
ncbi:very large membrane [Cryptosporidium xiaoi]|uniref:Very large membrane n=1 Tax=Cryptosporidium xiaoi TaxID=659607 RepID=A0AAV9Y3C9_9CRYT